MTLAAALALPAQAQVFEITPVLLPGTPLPLPGTPSVGAIQGYQENAAGQLGFGAILAPGPPTDGVFRRTGETIETIALPGDEAPGTGGRTFGAVYFAGIDASGDVFLLGNGCDEVPTGGWVCFEGLYRATPGGLAPIALDGQAAPGTGGRTFANPFSPIASSPSGHVAFGASLRGVGTSPIGGLFLAGSGTLAPLALEGDPAPGTGQAFAAFPLHPLGVNSAGEVVFTAIFQWNPLRKGVFLRSDGALRVVALPGWAAPGGGTFTNVGQSQALDEDAKVAFDASIDGQAGAGVFVDSAGVLRTVARSGQPIPGTDAVFEKVQDPVIHAGAVAFNAYGDDPADPSGIFREVDGTLVSVALDGMQAPLGVGGTLHGVWGPTFTPSGDILFVAAFGEPASPYGVFRARLAPQVPALGVPGHAVAAALLCASGVWLAQRRPRRA